MIVSVCIGISIKKYYSARYQFFLEFINLLQYMKAEISFLKTDKFIILSKTLNKSYMINGFIREYISTCKGNSSILTNEENNCLNDILNSIGRNDVNGELNNIDYYLVEINKKYNEALEKYNLYGGFAVKISIVIGALVVIFLI